MTINLSIRNYSVTLAGLNCTKAVTSFTGSDQKLDNAAGLVCFKGTLVLGYPQNGTFESLDDRTNDRWSRGNTLIVRISDSSGSLRLPPRGGTLRILESAYDPKTRKLTLQVADILELLRGREALVNASKICLGTNSSKVDVINNLLMAAGAPILFANDSVDGFLNLPTAKLLDGSYIDQAAAIAASAGSFLWVDSAGNVRASAISTVNSATSLVIDAGSIVQTERVAGEAPPCELRIKGKAAVVKPANDHTHSDDQQFGPVALAGLKPKSKVAPLGEMIIRETTVEDDFVRGGKIRTVVTKVKEPLGIIFAGLPKYAGVTDLADSSVTHETYEYEQYAPIMGNSDASLCTQGNQGRLKKHTLTIEKPIGVVLKTVYASYPKKMQEQLHYTDLTIAETTETNYSYTQTAFTDDYSDGYAAEWQIVLGIGPRITALKREPIGAVDPDDFLYRAKEPLGDPGVLVPSAYNVQLYKETSQGEWKKELQEFKPMCIAAPEAAKLIRTNSKSLSRAAIAQLVIAMQQIDDNIVISNAGQANPPAADTYSSIYTVLEKTAQVVLKLPVNAAEAYRQSRRDLSFEYISAVGQGLAAKLSAEAQCLALAKIWGALLWGRYKGVAYTTDLADAWWGYQPLCRVDVSEPTNRFAYLGDGFSIAMAGKRCVVSFDGILLGQIAQVPHVTPAVYDAGVLVTPAVITTIDAVLPPYKRWTALQSASGSAATIKRRTYTLEPVTRRLELASGSAIRDYATRKLTAGSGVSAHGQHSTHSIRAAGAGAVDVAKSLAWSEITAGRWQTMSDRQYRLITRL